MSTEETEGFKRICRPVWLVAGGGLAVAAGANTLRDGRLCLPGIRHQLILREDLAAFALKVFEVLGLEDRNEAVPPTGGAGHWERVVLDDSLDVGHSRPP